MRTKVPYKRSRITHVYKPDLGGERKVLRTLVQNPVLGEGIRILATDTYDQGLSGLEVLMYGLDQEVWHTLEVPADWIEGASPVELTEDGILVFQTHEESLQEKLKWLAEVVSGALANTKGHSLLHRVSAVEHADGVMAGNVITLGALLALAEENPGAPEIGSLERLGTRFESEAPEGLLSLQGELSRPVIRQNLTDYAENRIVGAVARFLFPEKKVDPLSEEEEAKLDPGVRRLVVWLRANGFDTSDSGDGISKFQSGGEIEGVLDFPHVMIPISDYRKAVGRSHDLVNLIQGTCLRIPEGVHVQVEYSPLDGISILSLYGMTDLLAWPEP